MKSLSCIRMSSFTLHLTTLALVILVATLCSVDFRYMEKPPQLKLIIQQEYIPAQSREAQLPNKEESVVELRKKDNAVGLPLDVDGSSTRNATVLALEKDVGVPPDAVAKDIADAPAFAATGWMEEEGLDVLDGDGDEEEEEEEEEYMPFAVGRSDEGCDVFSGKWVYDKVSMPHYKEEECRYINAQFKCQAYGRPDRAYQYWRWQPHRCNLQRFNGTFMLERLRGKRILFVGDSLSGSQFFSLVCLLGRSISHFRKSRRRSASLSIFVAPEYNATIGFYWAPFLVESNCDNVTNHRVKDRVIHLYPGSMDRHAEYWKGADVLIFNTYTWWLTGTNRMKTLRGTSRDGAKSIKEMKFEKVYRLVLKRIARWLERNMDPIKNRVFFTSMSPTHFRSVEWGGDLNGNCYGQRMPIFNPAYWGSASKKCIMQVVSEVLGKSKLPITVINITQLSEYRKDAHTSVYKQQRYELTRQQRRNPSSYADCVHWCLPGLQDTWNELFYNKLFFP